MHCHIRLLYICFELPSTKSLSLQRLRVSNSFKMAAVDFVSDLKPFKSMWKVRVKIVRMWKQYSGVVGETIEMVVVDSKVCSNSWLNMLLSMLFVNRSNTYFEIS